MNDRAIKTESRHSSSAQRVALGLIRLYQLTLSPWLGRQCRFYPTCSHYAADAIRTHGVIKGCSLALRRLSKCHPFHPGGVDLVPEPVHGSSCHAQAEHAHE